MKRKKYLQTRTLYKNDGPIMACITENINNDKVEKVLSFKYDNILKISRESKN